MGTEYTIYTEIYVKDKWYNMDSYVLTPSGKYVLAPLLDGKSFVCRFLDNMGDAGTLAFSELAEATQKYLLDEIKEESRGDLLKEKFAVYDYYTRIKSKYAREYQYEYYAPRREVVAFETGENEEINGWLTRESYDELPPEERNKYVFYKWNEPYGWYSTLSRVITRVETRLTDYQSEVSFGEEKFSEYLYDKTVPIRLIVEMH